MASGCPDISSTTYTPTVGLVANDGCNVVFGRVETKSAWICGQFAVVTVDFEGVNGSRPAGSGYGDGERPMGPQPTMAAVLAAISPARTVWTALPSG